MSSAMNKIMHRLRDRPARRIMWRVASRLNHIGDLRYRRLLRVPISGNVRVEVHGNGAGSYAVKPEGLGCESVMYSVGIGSEMSFDRSLAQQYGLRVEAFDPTEQSRRYIESVDLPRRFRFHQVAIGERTGVAEFTEIRPATQNYMAGTITAGASGPSSKVPSMRLSDAMIKLGDSRIDVLKLDIEGGEFAVLDDMLSNALDVRQIALEWHPQMVNRWHHGKAVGRYGWEFCAEYCRRLVLAGYEVVHVSPRGTEFSFSRITS